MRKWVGRSSLLIVASAVLLCGCSQAYFDSEPGVPPEAAGLGNESVESDPHPLVVWSENGEDWLVVTFGSSSCPTAPRSVVETDPGNFTIELGREGGPLCTADLGPTTFRMQAPRGTSPSLETSVDLGPGFKQILGPSHLPG